MQDAVTYTTKSLVGWIDVQEVGKLLKILDGLYTLKNMVVLPALLAGVHKVLELFDHIALHTKSTAPFLEGA